MLNLPLPCFLLYKLHSDNPDDVESYTAGYRYEVVDGQNRMRAMRAFFDATPIISADGKEEMITWKNSHLKELCEDEQDWFTQYEVSITVIHHSMTMDERKMLFTRHQNGTRISKAEYTKNSHHPVSLFIGRNRLLELFLKGLQKMQAVRSQWTHLVADCISLWLNRDNEDDPYECLNRDSSVLQKILDCRQIATPGSTYDIPVFPEHDSALIKAFEHLFLTMDLITKKSIVFHKFHVATLFHLLCIGTTGFTSNILEYWIKLTKTTIRAKSRHSPSESYEIRVELEELLLDILHDPDIATPKIKMVPQRASIPKSKRRSLWDVWFGKTAKTAPCQCCLVEIKKDDAKTWEAAHVVPVCKGGTNDLDNLVPTCVDCNRSCGSRNLFEWCRDEWKTAPCLSRMSSSAIAGAGIC